ncbi:hypothetical protein OUZ56_000935 [Daphnia magna]|uniref:Uncharacterized protein n=1 Tax=Daphnia magna TaxID=35525 RepID=A0ABR0A1B5_9CRUS|nr:hypothetical protein OUZ56_000935 [Daphnia magna]
MTTTKRQDSHRFNNGGSHGLQLEHDWLISKPNSIAKDAVQFRISNSPSALSLRTHQPDCNARQSWKSIRIFEFLIGPGRLPVRSPSPLRWRFRFITTVKECPEGEVNPLGQTHYSLYTLLFFNDRRRKNRLHGRPSKETRDRKRRLPAAEITVEAVANRSRNLDGFRPLFTHQENICSG